MKVNLDELDRKILKELISNARQSFREIAKKLRISVGTVVARTARMEREGIIKGYTALVDHEKIGYDLTAIIEIVVSKGKLIDMEKEVARFSSTCSVYDVTGLTDAIIIAKFKSREELSQFTKTLLSLPYVERTNTHVVLTTVKEDFRLDP